MSLPSWEDLSVRVRRSPRALYDLVADELNVDSFSELSVGVRRSRRKRYGVVASADGDYSFKDWEELDVNVRRSRMLMYKYIKLVVDGDVPVVTDVLTVTVTDSSEVAISGATVTIGEDSETTDAEGKAQFELAYDDYSATIEAEGYTTKTESLAFRSNHKNFTIALEAEAQTGTVTVTTVDSEQTPLENATCVLLHELAPPSPTNVVGGGLTGSDGTTLLYEFDEQGQPTQTVKQVEYGDYYLIAQWDDENPLEYSGSLTVDGDEEVTITLTPNQ